MHRGAVGAGVPTVRKNFWGKGAEFMGVSCNCTTPEGQSAAPLGGKKSHFYLVEESVVFNLGFD